MQHQIQQLYSISNKPTKTILGLMSGTSLDGLDMALCRFRGSGLNTKYELLHFTTHQYPHQLKQQLQVVFCKENVLLQNLCLLHNYLGNYYATIINNQLKQWNFTNTNVDLIASHGQTIYHAPKSKHNLNIFSNATLQIADADAIATNTGIITIADFRQKHIAAGGEGAPLAAYGDYFLLSSASENRVLLNIGGIANFTYLPASQNFNHIICSDAAPGNTLMDSYVNSINENLFYDKDAAMASAGTVNWALLQQLMTHNFFAKPFPKTTGQEEFNIEFIIQAMTDSATQYLNSNDVLATLNYFTAWGISNALQQLLPNNNYTVYASGGGVHNCLLMQNLQLLLPNIGIKTTEALNINANAKEAILFALLANECVSGNSKFYEQNNSQIPGITMGKISLP